MIENWDKSDIYNNSAIILNKKQPKKIISWITILIIILILFIIFSFVPFNIYKPYIGQVYCNESNSFLDINLEYSDFPVIKNKKLYIKRKEYDYEIIDIYENNVRLKINLDEELNINNNLVTLNILEDRTTLFDIIKNKIKKGFDL